MNLCNRRPRWLQLGIPSAKNADSKLPNPRPDAFFLTPRHECYEAQECKRGARALNYCMVLSLFHPISPLKIPALAFGENTLFHMYGRIAVLRVDPAHLCKRTRHAQPVRARRCALPVCFMELIDWGDQQRHLPLGHREGNASLKKSSESARETSLYACICACVGRLPTPRSLGVVV